MEYKVIQSGSSGNAVLLGNHILIDCGIPWYKVQPYADDIHLVLLGHVHSDHFKSSTVATLAKIRPAIRWGCCKWMVQHLLDAGVDRRQIDVYRPDGPVYSYGASSPEERFSVQPVELYHDVPNCGYKIIFADGTPQRESVFYATDTGQIDHVSAPGYTLYMLEANHREAEIAERIAEKQAAGKFAYEERARRFHLSREQAEAWLVKNAGPQSEYVFLHGHVD